MKDFRNFIQEEEKKYTGIKPDATDLIRISDANHYFNKYQAKQLILSGDVVPKGTLGCGCDSPYPRYLPAKEKTKCMNCRTEY